MQIWVNLMTMETQTATATPGVDTPDASDATIRGISRALGMVAKVAPCPACGHRPPKRPLGRPKRAIDVGKLSDAYRTTGTIRGAARALGVPPGTARDRLVDMGLVVPGGKA